MNYQEQALSFSCAGDGLFGILSVPAQPRARGVLVLVGGPQYRVGSHRQFTELARVLAADGTAAMRFDYRGMGDSEGEARNFEAVHDDLRAAIDAFCKSVPELREVVIWGLCDGASAAMFYAAQDARVTGLVLLNPWARTPDGLAKATLKHYYRARLLDPALWKKIAGGKFNFRAAFASLGRIVRSARGAGAAQAANQQPTAGTAAALPLPERMYAGLSAFKGKVLMIFSEPDLTAQEFLGLAQGTPRWRKLVGAATVQQLRLADADHTFSRRSWKDQVGRWTAEWVVSW